MLLRRIVPDALLLDEPLDGLLLEELLDELLDELLLGGELLEELLLLEEEELLEELLLLLPDGLLLEELLEEEELLEDEELLGGFGSWSVPEGRYGQWMRGQLPRPNLMHRSVALCGASCATGMVVLCRLT
jgi:hypothetical protein